MVDFINIWSDITQPSEECRYTNVKVDTPLGLARIEWKGWKKFDGHVLYVNDEYIETYNTLDEAKSGLVTYLQSVKTALTSWLDTGVLQS